MFTIDDLITSLNQLEVKGKRNLDILLGVILALEVMRDADKKTVTLNTDPAESTEQAEQTEGDVNG